MTAARRSLWPAIAAACVSCACATFTPLPPPAWIEPWTSNAAAGGLLVSTAPNAPGLGLKPGDVLYLRRWSTGRNDQRNDTTPPHTIDRVPIRHIGDGGRLHDYEVTLLTNFLVTNRRDTSGNLGGQVIDAVSANAVNMWNALVDTLRIQRRSDGVLKVIANLKHVLTEGHLAGNPYFPTVDVAEITGIDQPLTSPFDVFGLFPSVNDTFHRDSGAERQHLFTFVSAELNGIDFRRAGTEESAWTLKEVQDSGVCKAMKKAVKKDATFLDLEIAAIKVPGSGKIFWIVEGCGPAYIGCSGKNCSEIVQNLAE